MQIKTTFRIPLHTALITVMLRAPLEAEAIAAGDKRSKASRAEGRDKHDNGDEEVMGWAEAVTQPLPKTVEAPGPDGTPERKVILVDEPYMESPRKALEALRDDAPMILQQLHGAVAEAFPRPLAVPASPEEQAAHGKRVLVLQLGEERHPFRRITYSEWLFLSTEPEFVQSGRFSMQRLSQLAKSRYLGTDAPWDRDPLASMRCGGELRDAVLATVERTEGK